MSQHERGRADPGAKPDPAGSGGGPRPVRESNPHLAAGSNGANGRPAPLRFVADGEEWIAERCGGSVGGTGVLGPAYLVAIRFYRSAAPGEAVREVVTGRVEPGELYAEELAELFARARVLDPPARVEDDRRAGP
jgi:hypothetical protein